MPRCFRTRDHNPYFASPIQQNGYRCRLNNNCPTTVNISALECRTGILCTTQSFYNLHFQNLKIIHFLKSLQKSNILFFKVFFRYDYLIAGFSTISFFAYGSRNPCARFFQREVRGRKRLVDEYIHCNQNILYFCIK